LIRYCPMGGLLLSDSDYSPLRFVILAHSLTIKMIHNDDRARIVRDDKTGSLEFRDFKPISRYLHFDCLCTAFSKIKTNHSWYDKNRRATLLRHSRIRMREIIKIRKRGYWSKNRLGTWLPLQDKPSRYWALPPTSRCTHWEGLVNARKMQYKYTLRRYKIFFMKYFLHIFY